MELFQTTGDGSPRLSFDEDVSPPAREFHMTADTSKADLQGRMRRHKYYWGYEVRRRSFSQEELAKRVPFEALSDVELQPDQVPQRIVNRKMMNVAQNPTLRQLWEEGPQFKEGQRSREGQQSEWRELREPNQGRSEEDGAADVSRQYYQRRRDRKTAKSKHMI